MTAQQTTVISTVTVTALAIQLKRVLIRLRPWTPMVMGHLITLIWTPMEMASAMR